MAEADKTLDRLAGLGVTVHEILRYAYGGLLTFLVAALTAPASTKTVVEALGTTMTVMLAFSLGGTIYVGHRPILGKLLYLLHERVHMWFSMRSVGFTCRGDYFVREHHLSSIMATEAFRTVRDSAAFDQIKQRRFYLQHSELHTLYVTFVVLIVGSSVLWARPSAEALVTPSALLVVAGFALVSRFVGNILLCRQECKTLLLIPKETVRELLLTAQFVRPDNNSAAQPAAAADRPAANC